MNIASYFEKGVFAKSTGKHLCWSHFVIKVAYYEEHLWTSASILTLCRATYFQYRIRARDGIGKWYLKFGIGSDTEKYRSNITWQKICDIVFIWQMRSLQTKAHKYKKNVRNRIKIELNRSVINFLLPFLSVGQKECWF